MVSIVITRCDIKNSNGLTRICSKTDDLGSKLGQKVSKMAKMGQNQPKMG